MTSVAVLETITLVTPLAVRFRDDATGVLVGDGLVATLHAEDGGVTTGVVNRRGVFVFNDLPSMRAVEHGAGDAAFWAAQTPAFGFVLDVRDVLGRFLPMRLPVTIPRRGFLGLTGAPPTLTSDRLASLPLFSAPSRPGVEGMGTLRVDLFDAENGVRAAWALVEATAGNRPKVIGVADREGRVMLPLPMPAPEIESTNDDPGQRASDQKFPVVIAIRYGRLSPAEPPNLIDVLTQPLATAWQDSARTVPFTGADLPYGGELAPATPPANGQPRTSTLLITPAGA